ncbi:MAG: Tripartite ATP-independent transporter, DctQ component [Rhodobacteraceae bacterium HLUCCA24]|nr:MAG: Tripartite ATP-independent transporter, DctQ component [Rhodobacteraceae bacterium HLUCCA24]
MTFLAASASIHDRSAVAVTLVPDMLGGGARRALRIAVDAIVLAFALLMAWFCWRWFRPDVLIATGFDTRAFQQETFNFVYAEPTNTLGIPKIWVWLVMPLFTLGLILHAVHNLIAGLRGEAPEPEQAT